MQPSKKDSMTPQDWQNWGRNVLIFASPALIIFLTALANHTDLQVASGAALQAIIAALIDLLRKFSQGS